MATQDFSDIADKVAHTGKIDSADALAVRRAVYGDDGAISTAEAEALFAIEGARKVHCPEWSSLFVEALTDHVLNQQPLAGYLSEDNADFVQRQIERHKEPSTDGDVELVTNIIEKAREVPAAFSAFALRLVKDAVIYADGPDAKGRPLGAGRVSEADVALLSRILWGAGGEGLLAVSRDEAESLVAIADATAGAENTEAFDDLFARAIGNYLLGATGRAVPPRETALRWETEPGYKADVVGLLARVLENWSKALDPKFVADTLGNLRSLGENLEHELAAQNLARDAADAVAAVMTPEKAGWLLEHIDKNGVMTTPEKALVRFVAREASALDTSLAGAIAKVA